MSSLSPISFMFVAAGTARRARVSLARLYPSRVNAEPSWEGHGGTPATTALTVPVTDRGFWEGRYVLTELILRKADGETLVMNEAVVSITREKQIVRTTLVGLDGTVKEYICNGDHEVSIAVGIVALDESGQMTDDYPDAGVRKVREFLDENRAVEINSEFLAIFGIDRVIVTRFSITQETASNRQVINISALSDEDYVIKSNEY